MTKLKAHISSETNPSLPQHTPEKAWTNRGLERDILSALNDAYILHKMKHIRGKNFDHGMLKFDENWQIIEDTSRNAHKKGPVDVVGDVKNLNVVQIQKRLKSQIASNLSLSEEDKESYLNAINTFIHKEFSLQHLSEDKRELYRKYVKIGQQKAKEKTRLSEAEQLAYAREYTDIGITLINMLRQKNQNLVYKDGEVGNEGLAEIAKIFFKTIKYQSNSASSRAFDKVFHDGDYEFLREDDGAGSPKSIETLDSYINAIMYLLDSNGFNAYAKGGELGAKEREKAKKYFLNSLFSTYKLEESEKQKHLKEKTILHKEFAQIWEEAWQEISKESVDNKWLPTDRFKTEDSKMMKAGGRTLDIKDESGLRVTYYGAMDDQVNISEYIRDLTVTYFEKLSARDDVSIKSIKTARKGDFLSKEREDDIVRYFEGYFDENVEIERRNRGKKNVNHLESVEQKYQDYNQMPMSAPLKQAYNLASERITRGANGTYQDFKLIVEYEIDHPDAQKREEQKKIRLFQEISFYPVDNDLDMGNHRYLDLEKAFFQRVKNMNDADLGKTISLHRLRSFTERAIKGIARDVKKYEEQVKRGELPLPPNDNYKYLRIGDQRFSYQDMEVRIKENDQDFDEMIAAVINYFIKRNKLIYFNDMSMVNQGLVTPAQLKDEATYKLRRFTTYQVLKNMALDAKNRVKNIAFYAEGENPNDEFHIVKMDQLSDLFLLEDMVKSQTPLAQNEI